MPVEDSTPYSTIDNGNDNIDSDEETALLQPRPEENHHVAVPEEDLSTGRLLLILSGPYVLSFIFALDATLVATLATPISNDFASLPLLSWLASSFFVANTISQPLAGRLTDLYGRRNGLFCAASFFCLGNVICAASRSSLTVTVGRIIAGLGGGAIGPVATFVVGDLVPLRRRGPWQGSLNFWFGIGSSLGGPIGGIINDWIGWRATFWLPVPVTALAILLICLFLPPLVSAHLNDDAETGITHLIDIPGAALLVLSLTLLVLSLSAGGSALAWTSPLIISGLLLPVALLPLFFLQESRHRHAIIPPRLFRNRTVVAACLVNFFISLARFGIFFYGPVFFLAQGYSTTQAGLRFIPESLAVTCGSLGAGYIMRRTGRYYFLHAGLAGIFVATFTAITLTFSVNAFEWVPFVCFFFVGLGFSGMLSTTLIAFNASVPQNDQAVVTSTSYVFRSVGSALSVTLSSTVFRSVLTPSLRRRFGNDAHGRHIVTIARKSIRAMRNLPEPERGLAEDAYIESLSGVWVMLLGCTGLALITSLFIKEYRLYQRMDRTDRSG